MNAVHQTGTRDWTNRWPNVIFQIEWSASNWTCQQNWLNSGFFEYRMQRDQFRHLNADWNKHPTVSADSNLTFCISIWQSGVLFQRWTCLRKPKAANKCPRWKHQRIGLQSLSTLAVHSNLSSHNFASASPAFCSELVACDGRVFNKTQNQSQHWLSSRSMWVEITEKFHSREVKAKVSWKQKVEKAAENLKRNWNQMVNRLLHGCQRF